MVAANLSPRENEMNMKKAKDEKLSNKFKVEEVDFDDLSGYHDEQFDVIMSQDSFYLSKDKAKLISEIGRILSPGGVLIFTDILANTSVSIEQKNEILT